jgi:N-acetylmuramoyl-L-alanine amidase
MSTVDAILPAVTSYPVRGFGPVAAFGLVALWVLLLLLPTAGAAQRPEEEEPPPLTEAAHAETYGGEVPVSVAWTPTGLLVAIEPLVGRLGGELKMDPSGEGWFLTLGETEIAFGPGSAAITRGTEIVDLTRSPMVAPSAGVMVPLDFLDLTYGHLLGYSFEWDRETRSLIIRRGERREMPVTVDVVHLQGVTTVVFQFPEEVRYRSETTPGGVDVELVGARLPAADQGRRPLDDPLVREIELGAERLRLALRPGAEAESYTLSRPFRLVFDVYRGTEEPRRGIAGDTADGAPAPREALRPQEPREGLRTIVLDPGHGGEETGAIGPSGVAEKDLTLLLARALRSRLRSRLPVRVVLTRNEDIDLPLASRTAIANQNKADLFLSIHLNSAAGGYARAGGAETYFLSLQASDERAAQAAETENRVEGNPGRTVAGLDADGTAPDDGDPLYDLQLILWDLAQSHHLAESQRLARLIQEELNSTLALRDRGVKQAPFRVLMGAAMPAVLVELGFLSNPQEERRLQDPAYRAQLVDALVRAISRYRVLLESRSLSAAGASADPTGPGAIDLEPTEPEPTASRAGAGGHR